MKIAYSMEWERLATRLRDTFIFQLSLVSLEKFEKGVK